MPRDVPAAARASSRSLGPCASVEQEESVGAVGRPRKARRKARLFDEAACRSPTGSKSASPCKTPAARRRPGPSRSNTIARVDAVPRSMTTCGAYSRRPRVSEQGSVPGVAEHDSSARAAAARESPRLGFAQPSTAPDEFVGQRRQSEHRKVAAGERDAPGPTTDGARIRHQVRGNLVERMFGQTPVSRDLSAEDRQQGACPFCRRVRGCSRG